MNLHEYQAKQLFAEYGLPVASGEVVSSPAEAFAAAEKITAGQCVVKAQIHAGGRGKAGGVKLVNSPAEARDFAASWLGKSLVTIQTGPEGQPVNSILIEPATDIARELYLGAVLDRGTQRVTFIASAEGGVEIEHVAEHNPELILTTPIDPLCGAQPFQGRQLGFELGLNPVQVRQFSEIFVKLARFFVDFDLSLLEINPLVITSSGDLHCLDAKLNVDANALYRQPRLQEMRDFEQEDQRERQAAEWNLSYVALDGDIGCMVNGAGLAMATMDIIKLAGGNPANFLDVGGGATSERVSEAFKIILSDHSVRAILINIFGGIVRCDLVAEGIVKAVSEAGVEVPVVVRLEGNNSQRGSRILDESPVKITAASSLREAAELVVASARRG